MKTITPKTLSRRVLPYLPMLILFTFGALLAHAQADPFSTGSMAVQNTFTNTLAPLFALIAVIGAAVSYKMGHAGAAVGLVGAGAAAVAMMKAQAILAWIGA